VHWQKDCGPVRPCHGGPPSSEWCQIDNDLWREGFIQIVFSLNGAIKMRDCATPNYNSLTSQNKLFQLKDTRKTFFLHNERVLKTERKDVKKVVTFLLYNKTFFVTRQ